MKTIQRQSVAGKITGRKPQRVRRKQKPEPVQQRLTHPVVQRVLSEARSRRKARVARMREAGHLTEQPTPFAVLPSREPFTRAAANTLVAQRRNERMAKRWERVESLIRAMKDATRGIELASEAFRIAVSRMHLKRMLAGFDAMRR